MSLQIGRILIEAAHRPFIAEESKRGEKTPCKMTTADHKASQQLVSSVVVRTRRPLTVSVGPVLV